MLSAVHSSTDVALLRMVTSAEVEAPMHEIASPASRARLMGCDDGHLDIEDASAEFDDGLRRPRVELWRCWLRRWWILRL